MGINAYFSPGARIGTCSVVGPGVNLQGALEPFKMISMDRKSYVVKENKITTSSETKIEI